MKYWFVFFLKCIYICRQVSPIPVCHFLPSRFFANSTGLFKEKNGFTFISTHATPLTAVVIGLCSELLHTCCEWRVFFLCFFFFFFPSSNWSFNLTLVTCETYCFCGLHFVSGIVQQRVCVVVKAGTRRWSLQTRELRWCKADKEEKAVYRYSLQTSFKSHQNVDKNNTKGSFALSINLFIWLFQSVFVVDVLLGFTHITCRDLSLCCEHHL